MKLFEKKPKKQKKPREQAEQKKPKEQAEQKKPKAQTEQKKLRRKLSVKKLIGFVLLGIALLAALSSLIIWAKLKPMYREAQDKSFEILSGMSEGTFRMESATRIYDTNGEMIGRIGSANYAYVPISKVSEYVQNGYIATEDRNFTHHHGIDYRAMLRAALKLAKNRGEITQGGSTITMQVMKNNVLTQERSFSRKMLEILLALSAEKQYNKAQIMEYYVNSCYYGNQCYGVQSAAKYYFGKDADELTAGEAAMLIGTSNRPNALNPSADYEGCLEKRDEILDNMVSGGYLSQKEADAAKKEAPEIVEFKEKVDNEDAMTTYAIHCAALKLMELDGFAFAYTFEDEAAYDTYQESYKKVYAETCDRIRAGGYQIFTSLDPKMQKQFQHSVDTQLAGETEKDSEGVYALQAAGICIDNENGKVIAVIGGRSGSGEYNRAYQAQRQAGSAIKPLLDYGPAINEGRISAGTMMQDEKVTFNGYSPRNYNDIYRGSISVREAVARSSNAVAVQALSETGMQTAIDYLGKLRFRTLSFADNYNLSAGLGSLTNGVTVEDMARGFAAIENGGRIRESDCLLSLQSDLDGLLFEEAGAEEPVFNADTAFILTDMMEGVCREEYGTAYEYVSDAQYYAGKTGTTNNNQDIWFAGFSPCYTAVTWVGYDLPRESETLADDKYNLKIWADFMDQVHLGKAKQDYTIPETTLLDDGSGNHTHPDYTQDTYAGRPSGSDYISGLLLERMEELVIQQRIEEEIEAAKALVEKFEAFQIEDTSEIELFETRYNEALTAIEQIEDEAEQAPLKERIAKKYKLLAGEVETKWLAAKAGEEKEAEEQTYLQNQEAAQRSLEEAGTRAHDAYVRTVQNYVSALNARTIYTDGIRDMVERAKEALAKCEGFEEYESLLASVNQAIGHVNQLPTLETVQEQAAEAARAEEASKKTEPDPEVVVPETTGNTDEKLSDDGADAEER